MEVPVSETKVMTPKFRVSFPNVFRPGKAMQEGAEPKYGITMLFPKGACSPREWG